MEQKVLDKLNNFFHKYSKEKLRARNIVIHPSEKIEYIYFIERGDVKQSLVTLRGEDIILHVYSSGAYFPIMLVMSNMPNKYYFEACNDTIVYKAPACEVLDLVHTDIDICFDLASRCSTGLTKLLIKTENTLYQDAYHKVLVILIYLTQKFGVKTGNTVLINMHLTHYDIASWTGLQRETASRQIEKLIEKGILHSNNHMLSVNQDKLFAEERAYKYYQAKK